MTASLLIPMLRALVPVIVPILLAMGINISPDLLTLVVENLGAVLVALGALKLAFPSIKAAWKYQRSAD